MSLPQTSAIATVTRDPRRIRVLFGGHEIGESADVLVLREPGAPPVLYFPRGSVEMTVLTRTPQETNDAAKGRTTWFTLYRDGQVLEGAAWSFETPPPTYQAIARRIAFHAPHFEFAAHGQSPADWRLDAGGPPEFTSLHFADVGALASALARAAAAHHDHERQVGAADPDWPDWYAAYIAAEPAA